MKELDFNNRVSRIGITTIVFSALFYVIIEATKVISEMPYMVVVNSKFEVPSEVLVMSAVVSSIVLMLIQLIRYIFEELHCLAAFENLDTQNTHIEKANLIYREFIYMSNFILRLTVSIVCVLSILFGDAIDLVKIFYGVIIVVFGFDIWRNYIKDFSSKYNGEKVKLIAFLFFWILSFVLVLILVISVLDNNVAEELNIEYLQSGEIVIKGGSRFPQEFELTVKRVLDGDKVYVTSKKFSRDEFDLAYTNYNQTYENRNVGFINSTENERRYVISKSQAYFTKTIDLSMYLFEGKNEVSLIILKNGAFNRKNIEITNIANVSDKSIEFIQSSILVNP